MITKYAADSIFDSGSVQQQSLGNAVAKLVENGDYSFISLCLCVKFAV
jgi:hypothetical protein